VIDLKEAMNGLVQEPTLAMDKLQFGSCVVILIVNVV